MQTESDLIKNRLRPLPQRKIAAKPVPQALPPLFTRELKLPIIYKSAPYVGKRALTKFEELGKKLKGKPLQDYSSQFSTPLLTTRNHSMGNSPLFTLCD